MNKFFLLACFVVTFIAFGCAPLPQKNVFEMPPAADGKPTYVSMTDNVPEIGELAEVYLGDRMLVQRTGQYKDCVVPKFGAEKSVMGFIASIKIDEPLCKREKTDSYYYPNYINYIRSDGKYGQIIKLVFTKDDKGLISVAQSANGMGINLAKGKTLQDFEIGPYFLYAENSFQRSIEYAGKSGSVLRFLYTETKDNMARTAFNREFTVDMKDGNVAAFKGAIIEIIEANNSSIKYIVKRHFR